MGIAPYKTFTFDGTSSSAYGVYLTGEGVFNAPVRAVEMIEIPGRNGNFALDQGRFENITVTYRAGMFDVNESNFADKVSAARNWLCSKVGYVRLEDDYNPNEYRMAVYSNGLELDHDMLIAGEFEITFDCKPQRWLTSGETAVSVTSGDTLTNPTLFDASPLLEVEGNGAISLNDKTINLYNIPYGIMQILPFTEEAAWSEGGDPLVKWSFPENRTNNGDPIFIYAPTFDLAFVSSKSLAKVVVSSQSSGTAMASCSGLNGNVRFVRNDITFSQTGSETTFSGGGATLVFTATDNTTSTLTFSVTIKYNPHAVPGKGTLQLSIAQSDGGGFVKSATLGSIYMSINGLVANSSISGLGQPTYIDLDIGEAYKVESGNILPLNKAVSLPSDLPTLVAGANTITFDNTITDLKVVPRWWKV